jgi:hypothetical protein
VAWGPNAIPPPPGMSGATALELDMHYGAEVAGWAPHRPLRPLGLHVDDDRPTIRDLGDYGGDRGRRA